MISIVTFINFVAIFMLKLLSKIIVMCYFNVARMSNETVFVGCHFGGLLTTKENYGASYVSGRFKLLKLNCQQRMKKFYRAIGISKEKFEINIVSNCRINDSKTTVIEVSNDE